MKLKDIGEFGFIDRIAPLGNFRSEGVVKGIGDDCAVISIGGPDHLLVTTDLLVERVHFLMNWARPEVIGGKILTANLSDIAACGGTPRDAFISLAIPETIEVEWLDGLYRGMANVARTFDVNLLGGDTTGSKGDFAINIAVTGLVPVDEVLFRHTAGADDIIVLTGPVGESGAGLEILLSSPEMPPEMATPLVASHLEPRAHVKEGRLLARSRACTAAIDISDGLSSDLRHICLDSGVGAVIYEAQLPINPVLAQVARIMRKDPLDWVLNGGEDYVLLAAVKPGSIEDLQKKFEAEGTELLPIGNFTADPSMELVRIDGTRQDIGPGGWDHFRTS
jgi:thiamine-monophosphate kinase